MTSIIERLMAMGGLAGTCFLAVLMSATHLAGAVLQEASQTEEARALLSLIREKRIRAKEPQRVWDAISRLGELREEAAIPDLIGLLTFPRTFSWESPDSHMEIQPISCGSRYPATDALAQIGRPALPALTKVVADSDPNSQRSKNAIYAIIGIFREDLQAGADYLRSFSADSRTKVKRERVAAASAELRRLKKGIEERKNH